MNWGIGFDMHERYDWRMTYSCLTVLYNHIWLDARSNRIWGIVLTLDSERAHRSRPRLFLSARSLFVFSLSFFVSVNVRQSIRKSNSTGFYYSAIIILSVIYQNSGKIRFVARGARYSLCGKKYFLYKYFSWDEIALDHYVIAIIVRAAFIAARDHKDKSNSR